MGKHSLKLIKDGYQEYTTTFQAQETSLIKITHKLIKQDSKNNEKISDFIKLTTAKHNANFGGLREMNNWIQTHGCAGYHVCDYDELYANTDYQVLDLAFTSEEINEWVKEVGNKWGWVRGKECNADPCQDCCCWTVGKTSRMCKSSWYGGKYHSTLKI